jgi:hypothetical protein
VYLINSLRKASVFSKLMCQVSLCVLKELVFGLFGCLESLRVRLASVG